MIEAFAVELPAFVFTWDGTQEDAQAITKMLVDNLDELSVGRANLRIDTRDGPRLSFTIYEGSELGHSLRMKPGDSATVVVDPESGEPIAVFERLTSRDVIVLQESRRAIGE